MRATGAVATITLPSPNPRSVMQSISYKSALIGVFLILSLAGIGSVLYNAYSSTSAAVLKLSNEIIDRLSDRIVERAVDEVSTIEGYLYMNAALANSTGDIIAAQEQILPVMWQQLFHNKALRSAYIADQHGNLVLADQDPRPLTRVIDRGKTPIDEQLVYRSADFVPIARVTQVNDFDPRERPWFTASTAGQVHWSELYQFAYAGSESDVRSWGVTVSLAVTDAQGQRRFVLAADVTLQGLSDFLSAQTISEQVAIFVVDEQDRLVAYPYQLDLDRADSDADEPLPRVESLPQPWIQAAYDAYKAGGRQTDQTLVTQTDGETYITNATNFGPDLESSWRLVMIAPKAYLVRSAVGILRESLTISLILLLASLFVIYLVASYLSSPIQQLADNSRRIEKFRVDEVRPLTHRWRDIRELDDSLNTIGRELQTLARYAPVELVDQWLHHDHAIGIGAETRDLDLLMSGIADAPRLCRALAGKNAEKLLPLHFQALSDIIHDHRGTIDRYTGDGLRAFWGAPADIKGGTERACNSALLAIAGETEPQADEPLIQPDFAIHSGPALVGNFGSDQRMSYTAIGPAATDAAALLALNTRYGTRIIISDTSYQRVADAFRCRPLDVVHLHPGDPALTLYELVAGHNTQLPLDRSRFIDAYTLAFERYRQQAWEDALQELAGIPEHYRDDPSVRLLSRRCRGIADGSLAPPPADWNGAYPCPKTSPC